MICMPGNLAQRRFLVRFLVSMALYAPLSILAVWGLLRSHPNAVLAFLLAVLPALAIVGALVATAFYLAEEKDDFQRSVQVQSLLGGIGATLVVTTVWGYLENYGHFRHFDLLWIWGLFWLFTGLSFGFVKLRYR